ncbi:homoserine O-acetyltransferase [Nodosilinea sp. FACHB-131]|uniref:homoserine O-acetyltransferase MetX n=1 Tax=Cyanophyceae TaxID=3028117 RepID=UPI0016870A1B|nr:homoserine O-acetyltransferase [Nodosilinea sp. FACHB-131]MBD1874395.1 homoserine O-acetyltransferase [Nodosilinea sp. FACHB-131]
MSYLHLVSPHTQLYHLPDPLELELGGILPQVQVAYRTWGELSDRADNAVLVCHALTGTADVDDWWQPLLGPGRTLDPTQDFVVCSNILGSCYGTTGPTSLDPATGQPYGATFPAITVRDMVHVQAKLLEGLGVKSLRLVIGGSLGGMQSLEWGLQYGDRVGSLAVIAAPGRHSPWCIGLSEAQRQAIYTDPLWQDGHYSPDNPPAQGLAVARMIAMSTYRSWASFHHRFGRNPPTQSSPSHSHTPYAVTQYLHHQGHRLVERFDANTYVALTHAMDRHDVGAVYPGQDADRRYRTALGSIHQPTLVVSIDSDLLYCPAEQQELAELMPQAQLSWLYSPHGHDAFLIDMETLNEQVVAFRQRWALVNR